MSQMTIEEQNWQAIYTKLYSRAKRLAYTQGIRCVLGYYPGEHLPGAGIRAENRRADPIDGPFAHGYSTTL